MLREILFRLIIELPASTHTPESPELREERTRVIATAVADAADALTCRGATDCKRRWPGSSTELALVLTTIAWHESHFDRAVHAGECKPNQCDPLRRADGTVIRHQAASLWQIHMSPVVPAGVWEHLAGVNAESTGLAAANAARIAARGRAMCEYQHRRDKIDWRLATFSAYATSSLCSRPGMLERVATLARFTKKAELLRAAIKRKST
jgi:hypothetical protein